MKPRTNHPCPTCGAKFGEVCRDRAGLACKPHARRGPRPKRRYAVKGRHHDIEGQIYLFPVEP